MVNRVVVPEKQYTTMSGSNVRIYATDINGLYPVHGAIEMPDGSWLPAWWSPYGLSNTKDWDLIEIKPRIQTTVWINIHRRKDTDTEWCSIYNTKFEADKCINCSHRIACVKRLIDCEEGEGL